MLGRAAPDVEGKDESGSYIPAPGLVGQEVPPGEIRGPMSKAQTFEQSLSRLEIVVSRLESGDLPLVEALENYEEGVQLVRSCRAELDRAELVIRRLVERNGSVQSEQTSPAELFGGEG